MTAPAGDRPLSTETLGDLLDARYAVHATCQRSGCARQGKTRPVPVLALARKHGRAHPALAKDLRGILKCGACGGNDFAVTIIPDYHPQDRR